jgi:hypothetical protein
MTSKKPQNAGPGIAADFNLLIRFAAVGVLH